jgi:acyl carrier protein
MKIEQLIYDSIDELNETLEIDNRIEKNLGTLLFGSESNLDSIDLVGLITIIEERVEEEFNEYIPIADERALSLTNSPFNSISTLVNYIETLINEKR